MNTQFYIIRKQLLQDGCTVLKLILLISLFISVWTSPTIMRRQSDNSPCTDQLKDLKNDFLSLE